MAQRGRPKAELVLSADERAALEEWVRHHSTPQKLALRCRIILACATGASNKDVAAELGSTLHVVGKWRARFVEHRISGLEDTAQRGRPKAELVLSADERAALEEWVRHHSTPQKLALRCRIILACATGASDKDVAAELGSTLHVVGKWRARFVEHRISGLEDTAQRGGPRTVTDEQVVGLVVRTLEHTPQDAAYWSAQLMAKETGLSPSMVSRVWRAFGLHPYQFERLAPDLYFVDRVHDVVGLYLNPPERALVFCVDEKSQIHPLDRSQPALSMMSGIPQRQTADYVRHGITTLFSALAVATGKAIDSLHSQSRTEEFKNFLVKLDEEVPKDFHVHLLLDSYTTHRDPAIKNWLLAHPRFHLHIIDRFLWLNLIRRWSAELTDKQIWRGVHQPAQALEVDIRNWIATRNIDPRPYVWTRTADEILDSSR